MRALWQRGCDSPRFSPSLSRYNSQWFIELVQDLGHEIWIGDAAQIQASCVRKQKTDKLDAAHILKLVLKAASAPVDAEPRATRSALENAGLQPKMQAEIKALRLASKQDKAVLLEVLRTGTVPPERHAPQEKASTAAASCS